MWCSIEATINNHAFYARFDNFKSAELCAEALSEYHGITVKIMSGMRELKTIHCPKQITEKE